MRKPTSIKFGHRKIKIKYISAKQADKKGIYGQVEPAKDLIEIDKTLKPSQTLNTIIHECMHLIADHYSWEIPSNHEELVAETGTNGILDLLSTNPRLLDYLAFVLKKD